MRAGALVILLCLLAAPAASRALTPAFAARTWRVHHEREILAEFDSLLAIPDLASAPQDLRRNAEAIAVMMRRRGVRTRIIAGPGAAPVVIGALDTPGAQRTLGFYAHYDGQPLDPKDWASPPFTPTLRDRALDDGGQVIALPAPGDTLPAEARVYARDSGDDRAPVMAMMSALDAMNAAGIRQRSNLRFLFEGEEESGSPHLESAITPERSALAADLWLICDGPLHPTRRQLLYFGDRDVAQVDITVYGPHTELHSDHYGNWAPNPALSLARLLVSMKDDHDRVTIAHFYDGIVPLGVLEQQAIADAPAIDSTLMREYWLGGTEGAPASLAQLLTQPSLNIRGITSGHTGAQATNAIPAWATAALDLRLVKGMDPAASVQRLVDHVRAQGYFVVDHEPGAPERRAHAKVAWVAARHLGLGAVRTPMDLPIAQEVARVVDSVRGPAVRLPNMGGSLPLAELERALGAPTLVVPIANHDDHQHTFDENLRLQNLWDAIALMASLFAM